MSLTLVEFLALVPGAARKDQILAALYWSIHYKNSESLTASEVKALLSQARVKNAKSINAPDVLAKAGPLVDASQNNAQGHKLWKLTDTGTKDVRELLGLPDEQPEVAHNVGSLQKTAAQITDTVIRNYVDESILCLSVGALKASMVFLWSGAMRHMHLAAFAKGASVLTQAVQKHDTRAKDVRKVEDLALVKDVTFLLAYRELGVIDKGEWTILQHCLDTRNQCGHPSKYQPGIQKASSFVEDVVGIVFR
jgi:hypothetical protein